MNYKLEINNISIYAILALIILLGGLSLSLFYSDIGHAFIIAGLLIIYIILIAYKLIDRKFSVLFSLLTLMMLAGSQMSLSLYEKLGWYDKPVHFVAEFALTLLATHIINVRKLITAKNKYIFFIIILSVGIAMGGVWEIIEWFINNIKPVKYGYTATDTAMDLLIDLLGVTAASLPVLFQKEK